MGGSKEELKSPPTISTLSMKVCSFSSACYMKDTSEALGESVVARYTSGILSCLSEIASCPPGPPTSPSAARGLNL